MGFFNPRTFCPNCGAKIHTNNRRTGKVCPQCGVALTGKVKLGNKAELAPVPTGRQKEQQNK
jgi:predicted amidophosphoribosyltransferase